MEDAQLRLAERLRYPEDTSDLENWRETWSSAFKLRPREVITTSKALATRLAEIALSIRQSVGTILEIESENGPMRELLKSFQENLLHDLTEDGFADTYAQTLTYGLLSEKMIASLEGTSGSLASIKLTNPFLSELVDQCRAVGREQQQIDFDELGVGELEELLDNQDTKLDEVLRDFDRTATGEDPVLHFYELFLSEYNPQERKQKGVFYTPKPVVAFIVRSVHELLQTEFGLQDGLADTTTWGDMANRNEDLEIPEGMKPEDPFVQILDPATGTATFLVETIGVIYQAMIKRWESEGKLELEYQNLWNEYVPRHLLPRLHGYELMMAPYAIAHMKIGIKLYETGYRFKANERARIYLSNALEPPSDIQAEMEEISPALAHEANAVNEVKHNKRFTVVIGNPPYSKSMSKHRWSLSLVEEFKDGLNEKKSDLNREEWKFLSYSFLNIKRSTIGVTGLVINNAFLSAPTHRGIRRFMLESSTKLKILDLHGDSRKGESSPDGSVDENVFEIQQGICITLATITMSNSGTSVLEKANMYGPKERKYEQLSLISAPSKKFNDISPEAPTFSFNDKQNDKTSPYADWIPITEIFLNRNTGIQTKNDILFTDISKLDLRAMKDVLENVAKNNDITCKKYGLKDSSGWRVSKLYDIEFDGSAVHPFLYKPFDHRFIYYNTKVLGRARHSTMQHLLKPNIALVATRQVTRLPFGHAFVSRWPIEEKTGSHDRTTQLFPLYVYPKKGHLDIRDDNRLGTTSISSSFISKLHDVLGVITNCSKDCPDDMPVIVEDVFYYIYSVLHSLIIGSSTVMS